MYTLPSTYITSPAYESNNICTYICVYVVKYDFNF